MDPRSEATTPRLIALRQRSTHACLGCLGTLPEHALSCPWCQLPAPVSGWPLATRTGDPWLGREIAQRYLVTRVLGRGSASRVYEVEALRVTNRLALKAFRTDVEDHELVLQRLEREIEALGRLRNPHLVRFFDMVSLQPAGVGVLMERVEGQTLQELVDQHGPLSASRALLMTRQLLSAMIEPHELGMIHRDLKPENIMVERLPSGEDFLRVLDFGLVSIEGMLSLTSGFVGTPLYASPEQCQGREVDARSDLYAVGAILHLMLTGRPPFTGETPMSLFRQHASASVAPFADEIRQESGRGQAVEGLALRLLSKPPQLRAESARDALAMVDALLATWPSERAPWGRANTSNASGRFVERPGDTFSGSPARQQTPIGGAARVYQRAAPRPSLTPTRTLEGPAPQPRPTPPSSSSTIGMGIIKPRARAVTPVIEIVAQPRDIATVTRYEPSALVAPRGLSAVALGADLTLALAHDDALSCFQLALQSTQRWTRGAWQAASLAIAADTTLVGASDGAIWQGVRGQPALKERFRAALSEPFIAVTASRDGHTQLALQRGGRLYHELGKGWRRAGQLHASAHLIALDPTGALLAIATKEALAIVSVTAHQERSMCSVGEIRSLFFSLDGYLLACWRQDGRVEVRDATALTRKVATLRAPEDAVAVSFGPSGDLIALARRGDELHLITLR